MKSLSTCAVAVACSVLLAGSAFCAGSRSAGESLDRRVSVRWAGAKLTDCLGDLAKQTGAGFVIDPALPADKRAAKVTYAGTDVPLAIALGQALRAAGLRYTIRDGSILVSSPERLARELVHGGDDFVPEAVPMGRGEALTLLSPADDDDDFPLSDVRQIHNTPWKQVEEAKVNPATGLTDYPAPPIWIDSRDAESTRFKYTRAPSFVKPEHLPDPDALGEADQAAQADREALGRLIAIIKAHPDWGRVEIVEAIDKADSIAGAGQ